MITVTLTSHFIRLEPAQRLLMIEVLNETRELCFRMFPEGGVEVGEMQLLSRTPKGGAIDAGTDTPTSETMRRLCHFFPSLSEIDLREVPKEYRAAYGNLPRPFEFESGLNYLVSGVSDHAWEVSATCE